MSLSQRRKAKFSRSSAVPFTAAKGFSRALALSAFLLSAGSAPAAVIGLDQLSASLNAGDAVITSGDQVVLSGNVDNSIISNSRDITSDGDWRDSPLITHENNASDVLRAVNNSVWSLKDDAGGGAIFSGGSAELEAASGNINFSGNYTAGNGGASGGDVSFSDNYTESDGLASGGAIHSQGDITLTASGAVTFATSKDTLYSVKNIIVSADSLAVNGGSFTEGSPSGSISLTNVKQMTFGVSYASADHGVRAGDLFELRAPYTSVTLTGAQVRLSDDVTEGGEYDFLAVRTDNTPMVALSADAYRRQNGAVVSGQSGLGVIIYSLLLDKFMNKPLIWTGAEGNVWKSGLRGVDEWARSDDAISDDYYDGDRVVFSGSGRRDVTIAGTVKPQTVDVTASDYRFTGLADAGSLARPAALSGEILGVSGDAGVHWMKSDLENGAYKADSVNARIFSAVARAYYRAWESGTFSVMPFIGLRWGEDDYDYDVKQSGAVSGSFSQWAFPLGIKFDWAKRPVKNGWSVKPSVEVAYVRAAGDLDYRSAMISGGTAGGEYLSSVSDADNFRTALNLEARRKDFSLGLNVRGRWSSGQCDLSASLTGRWEF